MNYKFKNALLGGTFDHLHIGHKHFIEIACNQSEKLTIGLSRQVLFKDKFLSYLIEDYKTRENALKSYLKTKKQNKKTEIIPINNIYGNSLEEESFDAIFVTKTGVKNANKINKRRIEIGLSLLQIVVVAPLLDKKGKIIESKRIRAGEIDRKGNLYSDIFKKTLVLPDSLREKLKNPSGEVINIGKQKEAMSKSNFIVAIGDITVSRLLLENIRPHISIFDFKTKRQVIQDKSVLSLLPEPGAKVFNNPGTISNKATLAYSSAVKKYFATGKKQAIEVVGEEDLLALPAIMLSPLNSVVLYGLRGVGAVMVAVTEDKKNLIKEILEKFL